MNSNFVGQIHLKDPFKVFFKYVINVIIMNILKANEYYELLDASSRLCFMFCQYEPLWRVTLRIPRINMSKYNIEYNERLLVLSSHMHTNSCELYCSI